MECKNGQQKLVIYLLKSLNKIGRNYKIYNKEILAVIRELKIQKYLLESTKFKFKIWTNHKNLEFYESIEVK